MHEASSLPAKSHIRVSTKERQEKDILYKNRADPSASVNSYAI